jgi:HAD superfamily hydrolase (TIGR01450 family)
MLPISIAGGKRIGTDFSMRARETTIIQALKGADVDRYEAILCDLDGCLIASGGALPGAKDFVQSAGSRLSIVSNNSADTGATLSKKLNSIGLTLPAEAIFLAGELAVRTVAEEQPGAQVLLFAEPALHQLAVDLRLKPADERADVVVLARDTRFTLNCLERALRLLEQGAELVLTNPDLSHPNADGRPVPETGALFAALQACSPGIKARTFGKPEPFLINAALQTAGVQACEAVFVGDNVETDGAAAAHAGLDFLHLVANGHQKPLAAQQAAPDPALQPTTMEAASC